MSNILARLRPDIAPIRHSREFRLLYSGQAASSAGVMICYVALPYQAYQISRSSLVVGLLSCAELLPVLLAGLLGGALADAIERRSLILVTQAAAIADQPVLAGGRPAQLRRTAARAARRAARRCPRRRYRAPQPDPGHPGRRDRRSAGPRWWSACSAAQNCCPCCSPGCSAVPSPTLSSAAA